MLGCLVDARPAFGASLQRLQPSDKIYSVEEPSGFYGPSGTSSCIPFSCIDDLPAPPDDAKDSDVPDTRTVSTLEPASRGPETDGNDSASAYTTGDESSISTYIAGKSSLGNDAPNAMPSTSLTEEEPVALPLQGYLKVAKGKREFTQRVAVWAAQPRSNSMGRTVGRCLWVRRYVELTHDQLRTWHSPDQQAMPTKPLQAWPLKMMDEVALHGTDIKLHFRDGRTSCCLQASSSAEARTWCRTIRHTVAERLRDAFPIGWDVQAMLSPPNKGDLAPRLVNKEPLPRATVEVVQQLIDHSFFCKRKTKDRRGPMPLRLLVEQVTRVQNGAAWQEYDKEREHIRNEIGDSLKPLSPEVLTSQLGRPELVELVLGELDPRCQEHWLFHGTTEAAVQGISDREFRMDFAGKHRGTLYGKGVYLAECCSKADEYAEEEGEGGLCSMLICRVALGQILVNQESRPTNDLSELCRSSRCHSVCGDRWAAVGTYREFVLYQASRVYPAYIVHYRRISEAGLCMSMRQALDYEDQEASLLLVPLVARLAYEHSDPDIRYRLTLLLTSQDSFVAPALAAALSDPRPRLRRIVAHTLAKVASEARLVQKFDDGTIHRRNSSGPPAVAVAVPALIKCLADADATVRRAAALALEPMAHHAARAVPALTHCLKDEQADVRRAAALALGKLGAPSEPSVGDLGQCLNDDNEDVRQAAATSLGYLCAMSAPMVPELEAKLNHDPSVQVRVSAAFAIGQVGAAASPALPSLIQCLSDPHVEIRKAVAGSLAFLGHRIAKSGVPELIKALKDDDADVRRAAASALGQMGSAVATSEGVSMLSEGLIDSSTQVRRACAMALGRLGEKAVPAVRRLVKIGLVDSNDEVRSAVARALVDIGPYMGPGPTAQMVEQEMTVRLKDHCDEVRKAASMCLCRFKKDPDSEKLSYSMKRLEDSSNKRRGVYTLGVKS